MSPKLPLTPKRAVTVVALLIATHAVRPLVDQVYYRVGLRMGAFPTNADSIGIPLANAWTGWLIGWPLVILVAAFLGRTYTGSLSFLLFDWSRIRWSLFWTIPILILCL